MPVPYGLDTLLLIMHTRLCTGATVVLQGLDEVVIATIMHPVLLALEYVHKNNGIHRDVKVGSGWKPTSQMLLTPLQSATVVIQQWPCTATRTLKQPQWVQPQQACSYLPSACVTMLQNRSSSHSRCSRHMVLMYGPVC